MSNPKPQPLWQIVEQMEARAAKMHVLDPERALLREIVFELAAALRAHTEELSKQGWSPRTVEAFEHILGVPKEPATEKK